MTREFYDALPDGTTLHKVGMFMKSIQKVTKTIAITPEVDDTRPGNFVTIHGRNEYTGTYEDHVVTVTWLHSTWYEAVTHIETTWIQNPRLYRTLEFGYTESTRERLIAQSIREEVRIHAKRPT